MIFFKYFRILEVGRHRYPITDKFILDKSLSQLLTDRQTHLPNCLYSLFDIPTSRQISNLSLYRIDRILGIRFERMYVRVMHVGQRLTIHSMQITYIIFLKTFLHSFC